MGFSLLGSSGSKSNSTTYQADSSGSGNSDSSGEGSSNFSNSTGSVFNILNTDMDAVKLGASLADDGMAYNSKNFNNVVNFANDSVSKILDAKENDMNAVSASTFKVLDRGLDFAQDVTDGNSKFSRDMTEFYLNQNAKENSANRNMLMDTQQNVVDAWQGATKSTMALSTDYMSMLSSSQDSALAAIMKSSQTAQDTTLKAMNGIFETSKTSTERVIDNSLKYIVFGVIGLFAIPFLTKTFAK